MDIERHDPYRDEWLSDVREIQSMNLAVQTWVPSPFATKFSVVVYKDVLMRRVNMDVRSIHRHVNERFVEHREAERPEERSIVEDVYSIR